MVRKPVNAGFTFRACSNDRLATGASRPTFHQCWVSGSRTAFGGSVLLPVVPKFLDVQASAVYGKGSVPEPLAFSFLVVPVGGLPI
jgi:hypothetical protein